MDHTEIRQTVRGVVLAGAYQWSDAGFDRLLPRPLLPIAHRPLASYALGWLHDGGGVGAVTICSNPGSRALKARLSSQAPRGLALSFAEDPTPRGPAGCVADACRGLSEDTVVVVDGTTIPIADLRLVLESHRRSGAAVTVVVDETPARPGRPLVQTPSGIYVFDRSALDLVPERGFQDIKENFIPRLYEAGKLVATFGVPTATPRVINASTYLTVNQWAVERIAERGEELAGYCALGDLQAHATARLAVDAVIVGPVLVGPHVKVHSGAMIVGPATIGFGATVGRGAMVSRSAVWRKSVIGDRAVVDRCVVADLAYVEEKAMLVGGVASDRRRARPPRSEDREAAFVELLPSGLARKPALP